MKYYVVLPLFCMTALTGAGCTPAGAPKPLAKAAAKSAAATTGPPRKMHRVIEQPASIDAYEQTPLVAHISGYVKQVNTDIGQKVKADEVLAELAIPDMQQELKQKQALVVLAHGEVARAVAALDTAEAHMGTDKALVGEAESLRARAEANYERYKSEFQRVEELVHQKVLDKQILDETRNQFKAAEATRQEVEAKVKTAQAHVLESVAKRDKARADVQVAKANIATTQAEEARFQVLVDYRFIRAPFDGIVTKRSVDTGDYRQPNASGGSSALFVVARVDKLRIRADIPETEAAFIKVGMTGEVRIPVLPGQSFEAKVARTSNSLDPKLRTLRIELDYPNTTPGKILRPGTFATVIFTVAVEAAGK